MPAPRGIFVLFASFIFTAATAAAAMPPEPAANAVAWPASTGLVVAEVVTGGATASDEYVEIANAGLIEADLGGCEIVYATASGATVTRKATFAEPLLLEPGMHLLVANAAGIYGPLADVTYSGGLAADGGAVALRRGDGSVIDAVGWGTATNSYVEGSVAPAPPAKSSIERLPGGSGGNAQDTNDNRSDWFVQPNPIPQSLASAPAPGPAGVPTASPAATATPEPTATWTAIPTSTPSPTPPSTATVGPTSDPTGTPSASAEPSASVTPNLGPSPVPTPVPTPTPMSTPTQTSTPAVSPSQSSKASDSPPGVETIASARAGAIGTRVHVAGVVTVGPGLVGADDMIVIGDWSGGIFIHLSAPTTEPAIGCQVEVDGILAAPYGQLEIRNPVSLVLGANDKEPTGGVVPLADVGEGTEGSLVTVRGTVDSVGVDGGRLTIEIGDGTTTVRLLADPPTGLSRSDVMRGDVVVATGIVGQHASATGRLDGYRVWLRRRSDLGIEAPIEAATLNPVPAPTVDSIYLDLASALGTRGAAVDVEGVVTATAGLMDIGGPTIVVDDGSAAVAVLMPGSTAAPPLGMRVRLTGKVGRWEGGPTVLASGVQALGELEAVTPRSVAGPLDGSLEWQLVKVCGRIDQYVPAGSRWLLKMLVDGHEVVVLGEPAAGIPVTKSFVGRLAFAVGIVRRSTSDPAAFQLLPRSALDLRLGPAPDPVGAASVLGSARASGSGDSSGRAAGQNVEIGSLAGYLGRSVTVAGLVTDTGSGTATIDDGTGAVRVRASSDAEAIALLQPGDAIEVTGYVGEDDSGLVIEADPASIVDLPGDPGKVLATGGGLGGLVAGLATPSVAASPAAGAAIRRASTASMPCDFMIPAVLMTMLGVATAALYLVRNRISARRPATPAS
jgi:DNA/RNA endonuclease YhcR with UshA esterase domain